MTIHGSGESRRRYLWIADVIKALLIMSEKVQKSEIYNIGHHNSYSNNEIAQMIGDYLGLKDFISHEDDRVYNDKIYPCDSSKIELDFGWKPSKNLEDVLPETIEWYRSNIDLFKHHL